MPASIREESVAGGEPGDVLHVRHLVLKGSQEEIGGALARLAVERYGAGKVPWVDPLRTRCQREYLSRSYPIHLRRMRGVAAAMGHDVEDDSLDFSTLAYLVGVPACSVMALPPHTMASGHATVSRNYDFSTGTVSGALPAAGQPAATAEPYIMEVYPDEGYPSLFLCAYDLLGATLDGINSQGLCVALLADDESASRFAMEPTVAPSVGLSEGLVPRFLLDTCATAAEARRALLLSKQYYAGLPCHFLVADRHGDSFVWEYSQAHNRETIVDGGGRPQIVTNFLLHRYPSLDALPHEDDNPASMYSRFRALTSALAELAPPYDLQQIRQAHSRAAITQGALRPGLAPGRTLWHGLYDCEDRTLQIDFYLRDEPAADPAAPPRIVRSGYRSYALAAPGATREESVSTSSRFSTEEP